MFTKTLATLIAAAALTACVAPTPYRESGAQGNLFGYASNKLSDQLYRVRFTGSPRTPLRWVDAFVLYRSAQIAKEAGAPAFKIVEGTVDLGVLTGDDVFGQMDPLADVAVSLAAQPPQADGDQVVGTLAATPHMQRTAGALPVFRAPPAPVPRAPAPVLRYQAPVFIYLPSGAAGPAQPARSILVELRPDLKGMDEKTFVTDDLLARLGPRIKLTPPSPPSPPSPVAPRPASST